MDVAFPPELEAKLTDSTARHGRDPDQFVRDVVSRYCEEEARFTEAVRRGEEALERGEYLTHEQVGERLQRFTTLTVRWSLTAAEDPERICERIERDIRTRRGEWREQSMPGERG